MSVQQKKYLGCKHPTASNHATCGEKNLTSL